MTVLGPPSGFTVLTPARKMIVSRRWSLSHAMCPPHPSLSARGTAQHASPLPDEPEQVALSEQTVPEQLAVPTITTQRSSLVAATADAVFHMQMLLAWVRRLLPLRCSSEAHNESSIIHNKMSNHQGTTQNSTTPEGIQMEPGPRHPSTIGPVSALTMASSARPVLMHTGVTGGCGEQATFRYLTSSPTSDGDEVANCGNSSRVYRERD